MKKKTLQVNICRVRERERVTRTVKNKKSDEILFIKKIIIKRRNYHKFIITISERE